MQDLHFILCGKDAKIHCMSKVPAFHALKVRRLAAGTTQAPWPYAYAKRGFYEQ